MHNLTLMLFLGTGEYLGSCINSFVSTGVFVSLTKYGAKELNEGADQLHAHENPHLSYFIEGGNLEQRKGEQFVRSAGDIAFYEAGEPHINKSVKLPSANINLEFGKAFLSEYELTGSYIGNAIQSNSNSRFIILRLYNELLSAESQKEAAIHLLVLALVFGVPGKSGNNTPHWVKKVKQLIHDRWSDIPTLNEIAREANVHPVTISKGFPVYFNCTYGEYLRRLKVEKALQYLKTSSKSLTEVAYCCGFSDPSHFSRTFKSLTGFLPSRYREI
jgi:AraC family transcriptional regulator